MDEASLREAGPLKANQPAPSACASSTSTRLTHAPHVRRPLLACPFNPS